MHYSKPQLISTLEQGEQLDFLCFWGHRDGKELRIGKACLSQWYPRGFTYGGIYYPTAEHWMMWHKAQVFKDQQILGRVLRDKNPQVAKQLGRQVTGYQEAVWVEVAYEIVRQGCCHKFAQNKDLRAFLLSTGDKVLVEASPYDLRWGVGMVAADERITNPAEWAGENWLGFALMEARDTLKHIE